uniref:Cilia- and flagella-associated protein 126 n=1 Tax=Timema bartmani TaxID=61472 RepID=A0A7R9EVU4_9NEOP|nr:unnamed protein product [Timema bartmani]
MLVCFGSSVCQFSYDHSLLVCSSSSGCQFSDDHSMLVCFGSSVCQFSYEHSLLVCSSSSGCQFSDDHGLRVPVRASVCLVTITVYLFVPVRASVSSETITAFLFVLVRASVSSVTITACLFVPVRASVSSATITACLFVQALSSVSSVTITACWFVLVRASVSSVTIIACLFVPVRASVSSFEREFKAKRLGNWEVPKWYPERPRARRTTTRIIANDRGHLLPGIHRSDHTPWGRYLGTWDLPKRITRKLATELTAPPHARVSSWEKRSSHIPLTQAAESSPDYHLLRQDKVPSSPLERRHRGKTASAAHTKARKNGHRETLRHRSAHPPTLIKDPSPLQVRGHSATPPRPDDLPKPLSSSKGSSSGPHTPQNSSSRKNTPPTLHPSVPVLAGAYCSAQVAKQHAQDNLRHQPLPDTVEDAMYRALESNKDKHPGMALDVDPKVAAVGWKGYGAPGPTQCSKLRIYRPKTAGVIPSRVETEDSSRPSTSVDKKNKLKRQSNVSDMQLAICWDLKPGPDQTEPKLSPHIDGSNGSAAPAVFTLVHQPPPDSNPGDCGKSAGCGTLSQGSVPHLRPSSRNKTSADNSFVSISAGTAEKARNHPKTAWGEPESSKLIHDRLKELDQSMDSNNNRTKEKENNSPNIQNIKMMPGNYNGYGRDHSSGKNSRNNSGSLQRRAASMEKRNNEVLQRTASNSFDSGNGSALPRRKHHQSSPNLTNGNYHQTANHKHQSNHYVPGEIAYQDKQKNLQHSRQCVACELKSTERDPAEALLTRPHSNYKMAFKAGKPSNSFDSGICSSNGIRPLTCKDHPKVRVPKPRAPFAKRSYSIDTLAPPFSLWPGNTGQDYPEHWRLASVYQHSYKPIEARRKTLLNSVYQ